MIFGWIEFQAYSTILYYIQSNSVDAAKSSDNDPLFPYSCGHRKLGRYRIPQISNFDEYFERDTLNTIWFALISTLTQFRFIQCQLKLYLSFFWNIKNYFWFKSLYHQKSCGMLYGAWPLRGHWCGFLIDLCFERLLERCKLATR